MTKPKPKPKAKPETIRVRLISFDRKKVVRCIKPFEHDGVQYEPGMIFDWVKLGVKPHFVRRLYNRKVIRHIHEDRRIEYPFRPERKKIVDKVKKDTIETKTTPKKETKTTTKPKETATDGETKKKKFTKKK